MIDPHTKMGSRPGVIPFVLIVSTVTSVLIPATVTESTKVQMVIAKASIAGGACTARGA